jgi:hypothetical protein
MQTGTEVVTVLGKAWHMIRYTPTIVPTDAETKAVRGPALHPRQPGYPLMLVSRCITYWASGVSAFVMGEKHAGRVRVASPFELTKTLRNRRLS